MSLQRAFQGIAESPPSLVDLLFVSRKMGAVSYWISSGIKFFRRKWVFSKFKFFQK